jgi:hypothetical protein
MKLDDKTTAGIIIGLILVFALVFLGFTGLRTIAGLIIIACLPTYLILDTINIEKGEKIIFSIFISAGLFPGIVYWLGTVISFRLSIFIAFIIAMALALFLRKRNKHKSQQNKD